MLDHRATAGAGANLTSQARSEDRLPQGPVISTSMRLDKPAPPQASRSASPPPVENSLRFVIVVSETLVALLGQVPLIHPCTDPRTALSRRPQQEA